MQYAKFLLILLFSLFVLISIACSSGDNIVDDDGPTTEDPPDFYQIAEINVPAGMRTSDDSHAQLAVSYIDLMNSFANIVIPPPAAKACAHFSAVSDGEPDWVLKDTIGNLVITFNIFESPDFYAWDWIFDGDDGENSYNNWTAMHLEVHKTLDFGTLILYEYHSQNNALQWTWGHTEDDAYSMEYYEYPENNKYEVRIYPDNSGRLHHYGMVGQEYIQEFQVEWNQDGSGHWWEYENGEYSADGTW
ncbi:MAG TPA: hypothetical protein ENO22_12530 [candidate division Zixibacteria bacterium]|nr:hypothetical protein [candidate division Zixibacteria bacterium]